MIDDVLNEMVTNGLIIIVNEPVIDYTRYKIVPLIQSNPKAFSSTEMAMLCEVKEKWGNLTAREIAILKLAAKGLSNKNIASKLNLTESTVKSYLVDIFSKINVGSRTEAVIMGLKAGFLTLSDLE